MNSFMPARIAPGKRGYMISLYQWLLERKGYTEAEAEETVLRYDGGLDIPEEVKKDIKEYTEEFMQAFKG